MSGKELLRFASVWSNVSKDMLVSAGVISANAVGGSDWRRFNEDPIMFILKLPAERRDALAKLIGN